MTLYTTFQLLKLAGACGQKRGSGEGYDKLATALDGVTQYGKDTPISLARIVESNGMDDALWTLRAVLPAQETARDTLARLFACDCAEHVAGFYSAFKSDGWQPNDTLEVVRRYVHGQATVEELAAAGDAAGAAWAAREAAGEAAGAAWAAREAAGAAAGAAWAAGAAAREAAGAAWAAGAAARAAAREAAWDARTAAGAAAWDAERAWQTFRFLALLTSETIIAAEGRG